jgi:hypothetical protein
MYDISNKTNVYIEYTDLSVGFIIGSSLLICYIVKTMCRRCIRARNLRLLEQTRLHEYTSSTHESIPSTISQDYIRDSSNIDEELDSQEITIKNNNNRNNDRKYIDNSSSDDDPPVYNDVVSRI